RPAAVLPVPSGAPKTDCRIAPASRSPPRRLPAARARSRSSQDRFRAGGPSFRLICHCEEPKGDEAISNHLRRNGTRLLRCARNDAFLFWPITIALRHTAGTEHSLGTDIAERDGAQI